MERWTWHTVSCNEGRVVGSEGARVDECGAVRCVALRCTKAERGDDGSAQIKVKGKAGLGGAGEPRAQRQ